MGFLRNIWIPLFAVLISGCASEDDVGHIKVMMVDSPAPYDAVNIDLIGIEAHQASSDSNGGWISIGSNPGIYDLLTIRNGFGVIIADQNLPAGHYTQVRLLLGDRSTVVIDGVEHSLVVPSSMQTGLKLNHQFTIDPNVVYDLTLDFDAERSVVLTGNDQFQLSPVIRLQATQSSGTISGTALPAESASAASIVVGMDTVSAYADTASGYFKLMAVPAGTYTLTIVPTTIGYQDMALEAVTVVPGQDTNVGTLLLSGQQ